MTRFWMLFGVLFCPLAAAAAELPFAPLPNVPDYVATFVVKQGSGSSRRDSRIVTHHAGWARIDSVIDNPYRPTSYVSQTGPISITIYYQEPSGHKSVQILRGPAQHKSFGWNYEAFKTDESESLLGESCEVWNVARHRSRGYRDTITELTKHSCVSHDGIELSHRYASERYIGTSAEATEVERRPVAPSEVRPPSDLLDLKAWWLSMDANAAMPTDAPGDVTVVLQPVDAAPNARQTLKRTMRRHYPWIYTEDMLADGRRTLSIMNQAERLSIGFESDAAGEFTRLGMTKSLPPAKDGTPVPVDLGRKETILGEDCTWFDMMPGMADASLTQCRTLDGIVLSEARGGRGVHAAPLQAIQLHRAPVALAEVLPPPEILTRANWGIPE